MKCISCQQEIEDKSLFCELCGANQLANDKVEQSEQIKIITSDNNSLENRLDKADEVTQGIDGVYRWVYELNMWTNPVIIITLFKIAIIASLVPTIFVSLLALFESGYG